MVTASVGFQCPECVKGSGTRVVRAGQLLERPWVTQGLIVINVAVFLAQLAAGADLWRGGRLVGDGGVVAGQVADGEWWRLVTAGFLHVGIIHLGFNMVLLSMLGNMLEPRLGHVRFAILYFTALLAGSFGALLLSPESLTVGASGAVFGLMGAALVGASRQGINPLQTEVGTLVIFNLVFTFAVPNISVGGHLGGLAGGALAAILLLDDAKGARSALTVLAAIALAGAIVAGSLAVASAA